MIFIYLFETVGLLNNKKNLEYRISTPEKIAKNNADTSTTIKDLIPLLTFNPQLNSSNVLKSNINQSDQILITKLKQSQDKLQEEKRDQIFSILLSGANSQLAYEAQSNLIKHLGTITTIDKEEFYDI